MSLGLPDALRRRIHRHLERALRNHAIAHHTLRIAIKEASLHLLVEGTSAEDVVSRMRGAAEEFAKERGHDRSSLLTGVPRHIFLVDLVTEWAASAVGVPRERDSRAPGMSHFIDWQRSIGMREAPISRRHSSKRNQQHRDEGLSAGD